MTSIKDNTIFDKTSFLGSNNSTFIKELYLQYLKNPKTVPQSWIEFFDGLNEDKEAIQKEISGPSWTPKKNNNLRTSYVEKDLVKDKDKDKDKDKEVPTNGTTISQRNYEKGKEQSVKAIALIRAYRIRGTLNRKS